MWRMTTTKLLVVFSAFSVVVSSCGLIGDEGEQTQAQLIEQSGFTPTDEQTADTGETAESTTSTANPAAAVESTAAVLRVAVASESGSGAEGEPDSSTAPDPGTDASTSSSTATSATPTTATTAPTTAAPTTQAPTSTQAPTTATTPPPTTAAPTTTTVASTTTTTAPTPVNGLTYKGILAAGDNEINAFDNGRKKVKELFVSRGVQAGNLIEFSRRSGEQTNGVRATSVSAMQQGMAELNIGSNDACILFLTSHGNKQMWFVRGDTGLTPDKLDQMLDASCGDRPTVALISACYSGIFIGPLAQPNRVVLTAASATNTSFGCSPEATYTYWDGCLIDNFAQAGTWEDLYRRVTACIEGKESAAGVTPSRPQAHFGSNVSNMAIFGG